VPHILPSIPRGLSVRSAILSLSALLLASWIQGCLLSQDGGNAQHCSNMHVVEATKLLTPTDSVFELSTAPEDSAFTDGICPVQFQLSFGFDKDSLQALANAAGPFAMPLKGLNENAPSLFFMNDTQNVFTKWHTYLQRGLTFNGFDSTLHYLSTFPHPQGPSRRGTYSIRTSLSSLVTNPDSSVFVKARIRYHNGTYLNPTY
jgi:hypothetical protein